MCASLQNRKFSAIHKQQYDGKYEYTNAVGIRFANSLSLCLSTCISNKMCLSFFFNEIKNQCILHSDPFTYTNISGSGLGWKLYHTYEGLSGRCQNHVDFYYYRELDLCYHLGGAVPTNYVSIDAMCKGLGGKLIRLDSQAKVDYTKAILANIGIVYPHSIYIQGTNTIDPAKQWTYDDGTRMTFFNWHFGEPIRTGYINIVRAWNFTWVTVDVQPAAYYVTYMCEKR